MNVKAVTMFLLLCLPAFADLVAGVRAYANGDYATALREFVTPYPREKFSSG
jgi:hypothetical protein